MDFHTMIVRGDWVEFRERLRHETNNIFKIYDYLKKQNLECHQREAIFNVLIDIKYWGSDMTLFQYVDTVWYFKLSHTFHMEYILKLLRSGYDISTNERARIDGFIMTYRIVDGNKQEQLIEMLSYHPNLSLSVIDGCGQHMDLLEGATTYLDPKILHILLEYGVGTQLHRLSKIDDILSILEEYNPDVRSFVNELTTDTQDITERFGPSRISEIEKLIQSFLYLRRHTATITKSAR